MDCILGAVDDIAGGGRFAARADVFIADRLAAAKKGRVCGGLGLGVDLTRILDCGGRFTRGPVGALGRADGGIDAIEGDLVEPLGARVAGAADEDEAGDDGRDSDACAGEGESWAEVTPAGHRRLPLLHRG